MSSNTLTTRDGLVGNTPRYAGYTTPPYQRYLKDDAGNVINLTGVPTANFTLVFINQSDPSIVKLGQGTWTIVNAALGLASYQYAIVDTETAGNWYLILTLQIPGEPTPRVFDPEFLHIDLLAGGFIVSIQDVNITEVNGTAISSGNPVPTSGPVTMVDGASVAIGATTDTSSANTVVGVLKAIKASLAGTLAVNQQPVGTAVAPYGSNPAQTASAGADTLYKWGAGGTTTTNWQVIGNFTGGNIFYAFDQSSTVSTNQVYRLADGQIIVWNRTCTVLHVSSAAQQNFGGQTGIAIEAFL